MTPTSSTPGHKNLQRPELYYTAVRDAKVTVIRYALANQKGNVSKAAKLLGIQRTFLFRLCRELGINAAEYRPLDSPWRNRR